MNNDYLRSVFHSLAANSPRDNMPGPQGMDQIRARQQQMQNPVVYPRPGQGSIPGVPMPQAGIPGVPMQPPQGGIPGIPMTRPSQAPQQATPRDYQPAIPGVTQQAVPPRGTRISPGIYADGRGGTYRQSPARR